MKRLFVLFFAISLIGCGGSSGSDKDQNYSEIQKDKFRALTEHYIPYLSDTEPYDAVYEFRNFIHHVSIIRADPLELPFQAKYLEETVNQERGNLCQGLTFHLAAYLESYGWTYRMIELWTGTQTPGGIAYTHSVLEVWVNDHWELYDTTYNCVFSWAGETLGAKGIKDLLAIGIYPEVETSGYDQLRVFENWDYPTYWDYFNIIKESYTEIFY